MSETATYRVQDNNKCSKQLSTTRTAKSLTAAAWVNEGALDTRDTARSNNRLNTAALPTAAAAATAAAGTDAMSSTPPASVIRRTA